MLSKEGGLSSSIMKGVRQSVKGDTPFLLSPITWGAKKIFGDKKVDNALWKYLQSPVIKADIALGEKAQNLTKKIFGGKGSLWNEKKILPIGKASGRITKGQEVLIPSLFAPANKAGKVVIPILGSMKLEEMLGDNKMNQKPTITRADLTKTAEMLESLKGQKDIFIKQAYATKLLFKQAELGQILFPKTHNEFEEKVAELMHKDLNVVEEAIKMAAASEELTNTFGGLENPTNNGSESGKSAQYAFQRSLME